MAKIVTFEPLSSKPWSNIIRYKNCHEDISTYFLRDGSRYTGLTREDEKRLGEELRKDLNPNSEFWDTFFIRIGSEPLRLNLDSPMDELKYKFLKSHKLVKNSYSENKATAEYVLVDYDEEAKKENKGAKLKRKAFKEFDKLSANDIRKALRLYGFKSDNISAEQAEQKLFEVVENDPQQFLDIWVNNKNRQTQFLVEEAVAKNVIRKNKNAYMYGTEIIGRDMEDAIAFLDDKQNQEIKQIIMNEIDKK